MSGKELTIRKSSSNLNFPPALTTHLCDQTFMNSLRQNNSKAHNEHKMIQVNKRFMNKREQVSHVFTGESGLPPRPHVAHVHVQSQVMFNDSYFELKPRINKEKLMRYKVEKEMKSRLHLYSDELYLPGGIQYALRQKIKDNYSRNPLAVQIDTVDQVRTNRMSIRTETLVRCNSSIQMKKSLRHNSVRTEPLSKITNDEYQGGRVINQSQRKNVKKHFRVASAGEKVC